MSKQQQQVSKWAGREAFFFNQGANVAVWTIFLSLNVGMAVWGSWQFTAPHWHTSSDLLRITLPIARAAGRMITEFCNHSHYSIQICLDDDPSVHFHSLGLSSGQYNA